MQQTSSAWWRTSAALLGAGCFTFFGGANQKAHAQTYRVISVVPNGSSYATDIGENGAVCGVKSIGQTGFVWMRGPDGSDTFVVREMPVAPRAFSSSGTYIATDKGAYLDLFGQVLPAPSSYATDLPVGFQATSINDKAIMVGTITSNPANPFDVGSYPKGYWRDLLKPISQWLPFGYFGKNFYDWTGGFQPSWFLTGSGAAAINNSGLVGGLAYPNYPWGSGTSYPAPYVAPMLGHFTSGTQWDIAAQGSVSSVGVASLASAEQGGIYDVNEPGVGAGFALAFSDLSCQFPAFFQSGPREFHFLGQNPSQWIVPNMKGCVIGLNDKGEGAGWSNKIGEPGGKHYPCLFVRSTGLVKDLNTLLEGRKVTTIIGGQQITFYFPSDWTIDSAVDINNAGDIAATAHYKGDPLSHAVLLKRL